MDLIVRNIETVPKEIIQGIQNTLSEHTTDFDIDGEEFETIICDCCLKRKLKIGSWITIHNTKVCQRCIKTLVMENPLEKDVRKYRAKDVTFESSENLRKLCEGLIQYYMDSRYLFFFTRYEKENK